MVNHALYELESEDKDQELEDSEEDGDSEEVDGEESDDNQEVDNVKKAIVKKKIIIIHDERVTNYGDDLNWVHMGTGMLFIKFH